MPIARYLFAIFLMTIFFAPVIANAGKLYRGNPESKVYHNETCKYYSYPKSSVTFTSRKKAEKEGYRPCKFCFTEEQKKEGKHRNEGKGDEASMPRNSAVQKFSNAFEGR